MNVKKWLSIPFLYEKSTMVSYHEGFPEIQYAQLDQMYGTNGIMCFFLD